MALLALSPSAGGWAKSANGPRLSGCPSGRQACHAGWRPGPAMPAMPSASTSATWTAARRPRRRNMKRRTPAPPGSGTTGRALFHGCPLPRRRSRLAREPADASPGPHQHSRPGAQPPGRFRSASQEQGRSDHGHWSRQHAPWGRFLGKSVMPVRQQGQPPVCLIFIKLAGRALGDNSPAGVGGDACPAREGPMSFTIPKPLKTEHDHLHDDLRSAMAKGRGGSACRG